VSVYETHLWRRDETVKDDGGAALYDRWRQKEEEEEEDVLHCQL